MHSVVVVVVSTQGRSFYEALTHPDHGDGYGLPMLLALFVLMATTTAPPIEVTVVVPLCDNALIACGRAAAGDPRALETNLYWGAMYGAERWLSRAPGFHVVTKADAPDAERPALLRRVVVERRAAAGERVVRLTLLAFDGAHIDDAVAYFFAQARTPTSDLLVWAGHDRLMDVAPPTTTATTTATTTTPSRVAVLACESDRYFGPALRALGAQPVAMTRTFMAPEAYLLEALAGSVARHGVDARQPLRAALIAAYAKYQRLSTRAAGSVFTSLP